MNSSTSSPLRIVVVGAAGRMGQTLIKEISEKTEYTLCGAVERENSPHIGIDAGLLAGTKPLNVSVISDALEAFSKADAVLDFTSPEATVRFAGLAAQARIVHVIGTTGLSEEHGKLLHAAARHARIVQSGNMSLGVNLLAALIRKTAQILDADFDIEIVEMHHRQKVDAPSGTALMFGKAAAEGRGIPLSGNDIMARVGHTGTRPSGAIGFATLRGGTVVGDHSVLFVGSAERLEFSHKAENRSIFANGALKAARWAFPQKPGYYTMNDVLNLNSL